MAQPPSPLDAPSPGASSFPATGLSSVDATGSAEARRRAGHVAGFVLVAGALVAFATLETLSGRRVPSSFDFVVAATMCTGIACVMVPWNRIPAGWLHVLPIIATVEVALGVRLAGVYGEIAANYYVLVALFAAYAFSSRRAVAAHVTIAAAASALPLLYSNPHGTHTPARTAVGVLLIVVIAGIVTQLRERLQQRQRELADLAMRDPLTGVGNYRLLSERLDYETARHRRSGGSLTVMLLDLDGFKEINDTFGHLVGDRALIEVARALSLSVRSQDTLARQGGDEFSIVAPDTNDEQARRLATRAQMAITAAMSGSLTTSVGWVTFPTHAEDPATLLALADADLRRAKKARGVEGLERVAKPRAGILHVVERTAS